MASRYLALTGKRIDVQTMAQRARQGDEHAVAVFAEMGARLGSFVKKHQLEQFAPECIIFGGQISRSHDLFFAPFTEALGTTESECRVLPALDIEHSALRGVAKLVFDSRDDRLGRI